MQGDPAENIPKLVADTGAGLLVNDYSPLKLGRKWKDEVGCAGDAAIVLAGRARGVI